MMIMTYITMNPQSVAETVLREKSTTDATNTTAVGDVLFILGVSINNDLSCPGLRGSCHAAIRSSYNNEKFR